MYRRHTDNAGDISGRYIRLGTSRNDVHRFRSVRAYLEPASKSPSAGARPQILMTECAQDYAHQITAEDEHVPKSHAEVPGLFDATLHRAELPFRDGAIINPFDVQEGTDCLKDIRDQQGDKEGH